MAQANRAFESAFGGGACALMSIAAGAALSISGAVANAAPEFQYNYCEFLPVSSGTEDPDYSVVDAMIEAPVNPDVRVPGTRRYPFPICISQSPNKVTWTEQRPVNTDATGNDLDVVRRAFFYKPARSVRMKLPLIIWSHPAETADVVEDTPYVLTPTEN
jgi:hypothetical protein